jgi:hypothetical protein
MAQRRSKAGQEQEDVERRVAAAERSVTVLPLQEVWDATGALPLSGGEHLDRPAIETLIRAGAVRLVVADVGKPLEWVPEAKARSLWRSEVSERLVGPNQKAFIDDFNDGYFYRAHAWTDAAGIVSTVVLERHH